MPNNERSRAIGARLSNDQFFAVLERLTRTGELPTDYVRRLIAADCRAHGIEWPEYEFIPNEERARDKKGMPWITKRTPKK